MLELILFIKTSMKFSIVLRLIGALQALGVLKAKISNENARSEPFKLSWVKTSSHKSINLTKTGSLLKQCGKILYEEFH